MRIKIKAIGIKKNPMRIGKKAIRTGLTGNAYIFSNRRLRSIAFMLLPGVKITLALLTAAYF